MCSGEDLAKGGRYINGGEFTIFEGRKERAGVMIFGDVDLFGTEYAAGSRDTENIGTTGWWEVALWDLPIIWDARGKLCNFAVTNSFPVQCFHSHDLSVVASQTLCSSSSQLCIGSYVFPREDFNWALMR